MRTLEFARVVSSWLRIPNDEVINIFDILRNEKILPSKKSHISALDASNALICIMASSFSYHSGYSKWFHTLSQMSLQSIPDTDPLSIQPREPFTNLVGQTAGKRSLNGYLNFSETVASSFMRQDKNIGETEIYEISIETWGRIPVGKIKIFHKNEYYIYTYSPTGLQIEEEGLYQKVSISRGVISGIGWVMKSEKVLENS